MHGARFSIVVDIFIILDYIFNMNYYIKPTTDIFIKYLLGSRKNKDLLLSFINSVLEDSQFNKIVEVEIKNPFNLKSFIADKESILDIKAIDENNRQYNVEIQSTGNIHFKKRSLYYWAKLYSSQLEEGNKYIDLKPTICINILDFELFKEIDSLHTCFLLREQNLPEYVLTDHIVIHFLEIPKLRDKNIRTKLEKWLFYLKHEGKEEEKMKILLTDTDINKAHKVYKHFTEDERLREIYEARLKSKLDYNTDITLAKQEGLKEGKQKGLKEGKQEGLKEAKLDDAKKMLFKKYPIKDIADITGLTEKEIKKLKSAINN